MNKVQTPVDGFIQILTRLMTTENKKDNKVFIFTKEDVILMHGMVNKSLDIGIEAVINHYCKINRDLYKVDLSTLTRD
jgi:hypothetical protein